MSQCDREVDYTLYSTFTTGGEHERALTIWETPLGGHADELEASYVMAAAPGTVKLEYQTLPEPILPKHDLAHLGKRIYTGLWWYDNYPENITEKSPWMLQQKILWKSFVRSNRTRFFLPCSENSGKENVPSTKTTHKYFDLVFVKCIFCLIVHNKCYISYNLSIVRNFVQLWYGGGK